MARVAVRHDDHGVFAVSGLRVRRGHAGRGGSGPRGPACRSIVSTRPRVVRSLTGVKVTNRPPATAASASVAYVLHSLRSFSRSYANQSPALVSSAPASYSTRTPSSEITPCTGLLIVFRGVGSGLSVAGSRRRMGGKVSSAENGLPVQTR